MSQAGQRSGAETIRLSTLDVDPWRYVCPECGSTTIAVRQKLGDVKKHREYEPSLHPKTKMRDVGDYRCEDCPATFDEPFDKRHGEQRKPELSNDD